MKSVKEALLFAGKAVTAGLALAFVLSLAQPEWLDGLRQHWHGASSANTAHDSTAQPQPARFSYADAVERAAPAVVSIYTARVITEQPYQIVPNPTLQRFSGVPVGQPRRRLERALGSGVIVSADGYVLTNQHVIKDADEIQVALWGHETTTQARIVGSDRDTDLAVLKIEGSNLPAMTLDEGTQVAVGDVVLAIGNPYGLSQTVTQGIVSGLGRTGVTINAYENFIQTDAAINEGNSGGALINARGELIGINTVVLRGLVGAEGIGFAIPIRTARQVLNEIVEHGVVVRGWLGAEYGDAPILPGTLAAGMPRGVALTAVYPGGPADRAGLRPGDVLTEFDGIDIFDQNDLREREARRRPGSLVSIAGFRAGLPIHGEIALMQRPDLTRGG